MQFRARCLSKFLEQQEIGAVPEAVARSSDLRSRNRPTGKLRHFCLSGSGGSPIFEQRLASRAVTCAFSAASMTAAIAAAKNRAACGSSRADRGFADQGGAFQSAYITPKSDNDVTSLVRMSSSLEAPPGNFVALGSRRMSSHDAKLPPRPICPAEDPRSRAGSALGRSSFSFNLRVWAMYATVCPFDPCRRLEPLLAKAAK